MSINTEIWHADIPAHGIHNAFLYLSLRLHLTIAANFLNQEISIMRSNLKTHFLVNTPDARDGRNDPLPSLTLACPSEQRILSTVFIAHCFFFWRRTACVLSSASSKGVILSSNCIVSRASSDGSSRRLAQARFWRPQHMQWTASEASLTVRTGSHRRTCMKIACDN